MEDTLLDYFELIKPFYQRNKGSQSAKENKPVSNINSYYR